MWRSKPRLSLRVLAWVKREWTPLTKCLSLDEMSHMGVCARVHERLPLRFQSSPVGATPADTKSGDKFETVSGIRFKWGLDEEKIHFRITVINKRL